MKSLWNWMCRRPEPMCKYFNEEEPMRKITPEEIEATIRKEEDYKVGQKTTVVVLTLQSGFEIVGTSACVDAAAYDHEIGVKYAREKAVNKLWEFLAFNLQKELCNQEQFAEVGGL